MSPQSVREAAAASRSPALAASSALDEDDESSAAFSSCISVRSRSSTIATTRSQSYAFHHDHEEGLSSYFDTTEPDQERFCVLAPSHTNVTASPRTDPGLEDCHQQRGEGDGSGKEGEHHHHQRHAESVGPPVPEIRIPLSAVARQGLIELSRDDWKSLYLSTSKNLEVARAHAHRTNDENRQLKRKLIEMQKTLFEARRNRSQQLLRSVPDHLYPWSIPDSRRSVGNSTTATTSTRTTTSTTLVVTSTASEEDSSSSDGNGVPQLSYLPQHHHRHQEALLLPSPRPYKVHRRGLTPVVSTVTHGSPAHPGTML